ncbi:MAG: hypothetical protein ACOCG5_06560 [Candidatus Alkaliphilus sp. MAG34]
MAKIIDERRELILRVRAICFFGNENLFVREAIGKYQILYSMF